MKNIFDWIKRRWEIFVIFILGLTPLLWYKNPNSLALGHDMGYPINPIVFFQDRLFLWTDRIGLGWDQTLGSAATLIHGLEAFVTSLGFSIFDTQKIIFIFWFLLPGLAMYYFVSTIHREREQWFIRLGASLFYMFNHFLLQAWFIAERTKISLFIALPIVLGLTINIVDRKIPPLKGLSLMFLIFLLFNGGGGLPLFGGLLLSLSLGFLFFGGLRLRKDFKSELKRLILIAVGIFSSFILANFYWVFPTLVKALSSYQESLSSIGGISGVLAWSFEISKFASILNLIRLQGIPDWYDNPTHPYSKFFLENPILILVSFLIPIIVFSSLFLIKKAPEYKKYIIFLNIVAVFGIIFTAGSHPPFGTIYNFFLAFVPGFAIFRTPFYKFAPALWFAYSYLFAFSTYYLTQNLKQLKIVLRFLILPAILIYSFPFFTGSFFNWREGFSTMTNVPPYVLSFADFANSNLTFNDRVLTFPSQNLGWNTSVYRWGYWSTSPVGSLLTNKSLITNDRELPESGKKLTEIIYRSILDETEDWEKAVRILGINYFLLYNDFYYDAKGFETENPAIYKERFQKLGFKKKEVFGQWELYEIPNANAKKLYIEEKVVPIYTNEDVLENQYFGIENILNLPLGNESFALNPTISDGKTSAILLQNCLFCDKEQKENPIFLPKTSILPGSILYPLVKYKENNQRNKFSKNINSKLDYHLGLTLKRLAEIKRLIDLGADENKTNSAVNELRRELSLLKNTVNKMDKNRGDMRLLVLRADNFLREENRILAQVSDNINTRDSTRNKLTDVRTFIALFTQQNRKYESSLPENTEKRYNFTLEKRGNYEVLVRKDEFDPELIVDRIVIDNRVANSRPVIKNKHYYSLGELLLNKGFHEISLFIRNPQNLLEGSEKLSFDINPITSDCRIFNLSPLSNKIYILNFDYLTERSAKADSGPFVEIEQILRDDVKVDDFQLKANSVTQTFDYKVATEKNIESINISICASPGFENSSNIRISNLSLSPFLTPALVLIPRENVFAGGRNEIQVAQINPTKYEVKVSSGSPYALVLNNKFNSNWRISDKEADLTHFTINGFANGWNIKKTGDYILTVEYRPQRYFYIGWVITGIFISVAFVYLAYAIFKRK